MTKYVVGFLFNASTTKVALIKKEKPHWQALLLNGIGGKIEAGEDAHTAMCREFHEEAYLNLPPLIWKPFCSMRGINNDKSKFQIMYFFAIGNPRGIRSKESEQINVYDTDLVTSGTLRTVGNVPWIVALARDFAIGVHPPQHIFADYGQ